MDAEMRIQKINGITIITLYIFTLNSGIMGSEWFIYFAVISTMTVIFMLIYPEDLSK